MPRRVCGLMTTDLPKRKGMSGKSYELGATWRLLAAEGEAAGLPVVFFHPHDVDPAAGTVHGYRWDPLRGFRLQTEWVPPIIVDNVKLAVARYDAQYAATKRLLQRSGVLLLNPRLPDKWGVWQALCAYEPVVPHLPETALLQHASDFECWLQQHEAVFVKPVRGSGGQGILQIRELGDQFYTVHEQADYLLSRTELFDLAELLLTQPKEKYLLQRALPLLEVEDCKIDVRVVLHRDSEQRWQVVATVPRLGPHGQVVTNLARGGQVRSLAWLVDCSATHGFALPEREEIEQVALAGAEAVTAIRPTLAFLGIDIALDAAGGIWLLDVNPRPGRKVLAQDDRQRAFQLLIAYVRSLLESW